MKLFKNLLTAAVRMLLRKANTVRVYTTARGGICASFNNIPLKLLLWGLLFLDGCGNAVSVVDTMFLLLISAASTRQNKVPNYSNVSAFFHGGALRSSSGQTEGVLHRHGPPQHLCSSSSHTSVCTSTPASSTPTQHLSEELEEVFGLHLPQP